MKRILVVLCCLVSLTYQTYYFEYAQKHQHLHHMNKKGQNVYEKRCLENMTIHLVCHTHDDMGWLKTIEEYFQGDNQDRYDASVEIIIEGIITELAKDPQKKFIYAEVGYFSQWWNQANPTMKQMTKKVVSNGQLIFVGGGYVMNDEAAAHYEDIIDQMTLGHEWLLNEFGVVPRSGWQIDPFGHSAAQAVLFSLMGFDSVSFSRIDFQDKQERMLNKGLQMLWKPRTKLGDEASIFANVLFSHYSSPQGFSFDQRNSKQHIKANPEMKGYDVDQRSKSLIEYFKDMCLHYKTNVLMQTMGDDFTYTNALSELKDVDKLVNYINNSTEFNNTKFIYSTPDDYIADLNSHSKNVEYPVKQDDFFPYADNPLAYWTGYFTSRPNIKGHIRQLGRYIQTAKRYLALQTLFQNYNVQAYKSGLAALEEVLALGQHHDTITGTSIQDVVNNFVFLLNRAQHKMQQAIFGAAQYQTFKEIGELIEFQECATNETVNNCYITSNDIKVEAILVKVINGGKKRNINVRIKTSNKDWSVLNQNNQLVMSDIICSSIACDLYFSIPEAHAFSHQFYKLVPIQAKQIEPQRVVPSKFYQINPTDSFSFDKESQVLTLKICRKLKVRCILRNYTLQYGYYQSKASQYSFIEQEQQDSGGYIFRPQTERKNKKQQTNQTLIDINEVQIYQGQGMVQLSLEGEFIQANIRFYKDLSQGIEIETYVDSFDTDDGGKEIYLKITNEQIQNGKTFYTDSNGMNIQRREINIRETWNFKNNQSGIYETSNYYPVNGLIYIEDNQSGEKLSIVNDRAQGGSSLESGQIELMIHRRTQMDDGRGMGEPLADLDPDQPYAQITTNIKHILVISIPKYLEVDPRSIQYQNDQENIVLLGQSSNPFFQSNLISDKNQQQDLNEWVPEKVKWYLKAYSESEYVVRFYNVDDNIEQNVELPRWLKNQFEFQERSLTNNQQWDDLVKHRSKLKWNGKQYKYQERENINLNGGNIILRPQEIRTFKMLKKNLIQKAQQVHMEYKQSKYSFALATSIYILIFSLIY